MLRRLAVIFSVISITAAFSATPAAQFDTSCSLIVSIRDQKLMLLENGGRVAIYPVSTSKYGVGDLRGRMTTPLGNLMVAKKIGDNAPVGAVFHHRQWTGEIVQPNTPGRDPVTTRIIWLSGLQAQNAQAFDRCIYIHGTPEEKTIGRPASYGCIRMKASDIAVLYNEIPLRALVQIIPDHLPKVPRAQQMPVTATLIVQNQNAHFLTGRQRMMR
jgi:lipoprotein-anchoring transpeptidase ErfK/SrfK